MNAFMLWPLVFAAGLAAGLVYFRLLWLTVRHLSLSPHPIRLLLLSFAVRAGLTLGAFYLIVADGQWMRLLAALAGFIAAREICKYIWGAKKPAGYSPTVSTARPF